MSIRHKTWLLLPILCLALLAACDGGDDGEQGDENPPGYGRYEPSTCESTTGGDCFGCNLPPGLAALPASVTTDDLPWGEGRPFSANAPVNQKVGDNPTIHADSAAMIAQLVKDQEDAGFFIAINRWTMPVYIAEAGTQRYRLEIVNDWECGKALLDIPIPAWTRPDDTNDGRMVILDLEKNEFVDIWQGCTDGQTWNASWANVIAMDSTGIYPEGMSSRGSGFSLLGGMIWPHELAAGKIDHALVFSTTYARKGGPVDPATESDGYVGGGKYIPEGARVQLDPDYDISGLNAVEQTVAKALKEYGMYLVDIGGGIELQAVHTISYKENPYDALGMTLDEEGTYMFPNLSIEHFRVLDFGPQHPELTDGRCSDSDPRFEY